MEVNRATGTQGTDSSESTGAAQTRPATMGRDQFFRLLAAQMQYQNPLEPMDNTEFIAQMAQFSSLERLDEIGRLQTLGLLGRQVEVFDPETGMTFSDEVAGLDFSGPTVIVSLKEAEKDVPLDQIIAILVPEQAGQTPEEPEEDASDGA